MIVKVINLITNKMKAVFLSLCIFSIIETVFSHGRLIEPPSRSTAWRYGFKTTVNYNDHELFCGGFQVQWEVNGGKCGICGDPYNGPRLNELPNGIYAKNLVITRNYISGSVITAQVQLTANHYGYFQFKLCPATTMKSEVTQECLDENLLEVLNSKEKFKYILPSRKSQTFDVKLKLPDGITCNRCVLQWTYTTGNNWGNCDNGLSNVGCGPQETFRACADVKIDGNGSTFRPHSTKVPTNPETKPEGQKITTENTDSNEIDTKSKCRATGAFKSVPTMDQWCETNCAAGYCPKTHCTCSDNFIFLFQK